MFDWLSNLVSNLLTNVFNLKVGTSLFEGLHFFLYDTVKILILLSLMIFFISYLQSYIPPEKAKKAISKFSGLWANLVASLLGIITPFCSCSSVPLFIGFVSAGIPMGVTFSFLITSPEG